MKTVSAALVAAVVVLGASGLRAADELAVKKVLSLNAAMKIAAAAQAEAARRGATVVIAVVDDGAVSSCSTASTTRRWRASRSVSERRHWHAL